MENLLNLLWLVAVVLLVAATLREHARGRLVRSLPLALGCVALLGLVLFPALSMTDDLQRSQLVTETLGMHPADGLLRQSVEDLQHLQTALSPVLLLLIVGAACVVAAQRVRRDAACGLAPQILGVRPAAIRPPPVW